MISSARSCAFSSTSPLRFLIGTAGHIDHGKTSLVRSLTGIDTDRLKEEKARGITIELGFAPLDLKSLYMGRDGVDAWARTTRADMTRRYPVEAPHTHNALDDARSQAALARRLLSDPR